MIARRSHGQALAGSRHGDLSPCRSGAVAPGPPLCQGVENADSFMLLVVWDSLEDHMTGFRQALAIKDLAPDGKTVIDRKMVARPKGTGKSDALTCREAQPLPRRGGITIDHFGHEVCQTNRFWASLIKDRKAVTADGRIDSVSPWLPTTADATFGTRPTNTGWTAPRSPTGNCASGAK